MRCRKKMYIQDLQHFVLVAEWDAPLLLREIKVEKRVDTFFEVSALFLNDLGCVDKLGKR